jgi:CheY-like chemotaxis protein
MENPIMVEDRRRKPRKYTILVVDDQESLRNLIVTFLSRLGHSCVTAIDGVDALDKMKGNKIDAVVSDIKMPNMDGITLTSEFQHNTWTPRNDRQRLTKNAQLARLLRPNFIKAILS